MRLLPSQQHDGSGLYSLARNGIAPKREREHSPTPYMLLRYSTCRTVRSRKERSFRTSIADLGHVQPMLVPSPPGPPTRGTITSRFVASAGARKGEGGGGFLQVGSSPVFVLSFMFRPRDPRLFFLIFTFRLSGWTGCLLGAFMRWRDRSYTVVDRGGSISFLKAPHLGYEGLNPKRYACFKKKTRRDLSVFNLFGSGTLLVVEQRSFGKQ